MKNNTLLVILFGTNQSLIATSTPLKVHISQIRVEMKFGTQSEPCRYMYRTHSSVICVIHRWIKEGVYMYVLVLLLVIVLVIIRIYQSVST